MATTTAAASIQEYWLDAWQRGVLTLDVLRQRGNAYCERTRTEVPHVLSFKAELVMDGRTLSRPVNYVLARIQPPVSVETDPLKPPFVVVDPRAGHGPGIGGMKQDSEIGVALAAGHPCYFIGFLPEPTPGQTIEDVWQAQARFIQEVARLHPRAEGKPVIVANCQAGWQTMIMAALHPDLTGPILVAGSPLSYWAGVHGKNPLRYLGGLLGGTWLTALAGDLGKGIFDGANLVANFETMNPANTWWRKPYNVYSQVDTEAGRFLEFESWWGNPVLLNAGEMQWIADNLFVGNKLTSGALHTAEGVRIDLRNIRAPIIVFCSWGDDITPPQQALDWITDLYAHEQEIVENGQTIIYTLHPSIGHLGIFVSGKVAAREHRELTACMDMIDLMPPGLYEAVIADVEGAAKGDDERLFRLEPRTLDDIRAFGGNSAKDDRCFAAAAQVAERNLALYRTFAAPLVAAMSTEFTAELTRALHPNRLRFALFSDQNPAMPAVQGLAEQVRQDRRPARDDNPLRLVEQGVAAWISAGLEAYGLARDRMRETVFLATYGSPLVQALAGAERDASAGGPRIDRDLVREARQARLRTDLNRRFEAGGPVEAGLRALLYIRSAEGAADERAFALLRAFRAAQPPERQQPMARLKALVKEQFLLLRLDEERAVEAIPDLLPTAVGPRRALMETLRSVVVAPGPLDPEGRRRLQRIAALIDEPPEGPFQSEAMHA